VCRVTAQSRDTFYISDPSLSHSKIKKLDFNKLSAVSSYLPGDYNKVSSSHTTIKISPLGIYFSSSSMWDESEIILIDSAKFFCYYVSDIAGFASAGYYKMLGDEYFFKANASLYKKLKHTIRLKHYQLYFSDEFYTQATLKGDTLRAFAPTPN
jgi:hypothetical protein